MSSTRRDKSISHFHLDPKLIQQTDAKTTLDIGKFVYLDTDGIYKLAISNGTEIQANVQGYVWSFVGNDAFYLKSGFGPLEYRFPLPGDFSIPGNVGDELYLSASSYGDMQTTTPSAYGFIVGYKTDYGMLYRPDPLFCCTVSVSSAVGTISASDSDPWISLYELSHYVFDVSAASWSAYDTREIPLYEVVPSDLINTQLCGLIDITGSSKWIECISGSPTISLSGGDIEIYSFNYSSQTGSCSGYGTYISPVVLYGDLEDLVECIDGVASFGCPITGHSVITFTMDCSAACSGVSGS